MLRMIKHALRRFSKFCRDSLYNGPTFSKSVVGRGVECKVTYEELNAPYIEMDAADREYTSSAQMTQDQSDIKEAIALIAKNASPVGIMLMRKFVMWNC